LIVQPGCTRPKRCPRKDSRAKSNNILLARIRNPGKSFKSQIPVVEQALATAALMLGTDKSRGYCLEMICADFLAGSNLQEEEPETLILSLRRLFNLLPYALLCDFPKGIEATPCRD